MRTRNDDGPHAAVLHHRRLVQWRVRLVTINTIDRALQTGCGAGLAFAIERRQRHPRQIQDDLTAAALPYCNQPIPFMCWALDPLRRIRKGLDGQAFYPAA